MKVIKSLSNKGVKLVCYNNHLLVKREGTSEQIFKILNFYDTSDFPYRPKIGDYKLLDTKSYLLENFIQGELLETPTYKNIVSLVKSLTILYKDVATQVDVKRYFSDEFLQKLQSLPTFDEKELLAIHSLFGEFLTLVSGNKNIQLTQIHGDLKGDNVVLHEGDAILIDRERNKIGHIVQDLQKFIETNLHYDPLETDLFLNTFFTHKSISRGEFLQMECFYFFLNQILQLSKKRLSLDEFVAKNNEKFNRMINSKLYELSLHGKKIKIGLTSSLSSIFEKKKQIPVDESFDVLDITPFFNNQKQRMVVNKHLMMKYKDFITIHGAAFELINGKVVVLSGKTGSGKSYILKTLIEKGVIRKIFDEDLINLSKDGELFGLADQNFKGYSNGEYLYQKDDVTPFGSLDIMVVISSEFDKNINSISSLLVEHLIHEELIFDDALVNYYETFQFPVGIKTYHVKNTYSDEDFIFLLSHLGINL